MLTRRKPKTGRESPLLRRWRVALAEAQTSESEWARTRGRSQGHVGQVVAGARVSKVLMDEITAFIDQQERALAVRLKVAVTAA